MKVSLQSALGMAEQELAARRIKGRLGGISISQEKALYGFEFHTTADITADRPGATLFVAGDTGIIIDVRLPNRGSAGDVFNQWQLPLQSERAFDLFGKCIICLTGLTVAALSFTGRFHLL